MPQLDSPINQMTQANPPFDPAPSLTHTLREAARHGERAVLLCSFQKEETVLLDMLFGLEPKARVFAIDTHYLFPETYAYWREVEQRYGTSIEVFEGPSQEALEATHGERIWERKPELYLAIAKVAPLVTALGAAAAAGHAAPAGAPPSDHSRPAARPPSTSDPAPATAAPAGPAPHSDVPPYPHPPGQTSENITNPPGPCAHRLKPPTNSAQNCSRS